MQLQLDANKKYAFALEGGGAKGAYEVGVWKAFAEAGLQYEAVSGSSVGALNGALMAMQALQTAETVWDTITFSKVIDVDDEKMKAFFDGTLHWTQWGDFLKDMIVIVQQGGFDTQPLQDLIADVVDETKIKQSEVDFFLVTYSLTEKKEIQLHAKDIPFGTLHDMLLASAFFPAFKQKKIGGQYYTDGGIPNVLPVDVLLEHGYRDIIAVRLYGIGKKKRVKIPKDANIIEIAPKEKLCGMLQFDEMYTKRDKVLGYYDAKRVLYGLYGDIYYIERTWTEQKAYAALCMILQKQEQKTISLRELNEKYIPKIAKQGKIKGDYYDVFVYWLEQQAQKVELSPFAIYTEQALFQKLLAIQS